MISPDDQPIPPRFWWLKRISLASVLLLVALAGLRWWWGYEAHRRLQGEIDRIVAAGEPIYLEDFDSKNTVPDDQNAVVALDEACAAQVQQPTSEEWAPVEKSLEYPHRIVQPEVLAAFLEREGTALGKLRDSRRRTQIDWKVQFRSPSWMTVPGLGKLTLIRSLSKAAVADAVYRHSIADDGDSLERFDDMRRLCDVCCAFPTLIYQLSGYAIDSLTLSSFENVLPDLIISDDSAQRKDGVRPASRTQVKTFVNTLADDALIRRNFGTAFRAERSIQVDAFRQILTGAMTPGAFFGVPSPSTLLNWGWGWALSPLFESDTAELIRWYGCAIDMIQSGEWRGAVSLSAWTARLQTPSGSVLHPFSKILTPSLQGSFRIFFRARAKRQMAATALAIRLYQLDHDGKRPKELVELVPDYLQNVPLDPFADAKPLGYRPDADPPFLYTVFEDGVDQGGKYTINAFGYVDRKSLDWPFFLAPHPERERILREKEAKEAKEESKKHEAESPQTRKNSPDKKANSGQGDKDQQAR